MRWQESMAFLAVLATVVAGSPGNVSARFDVSTMIAVKGKAIVERENRAYPAKVRDLISIVDTVSTKEESRAKMLFVDDSVLTLGEKSRVVIKEYVYSKGIGGKSVFNLLEGEMRAVVGKTKFEVHTPTAIAAARGTIINIKVEIVNGIPTTTFFVLEGEIVVTPVPSAAGGEAQGAQPSAGAPAGSGSVTLTAGEMVTVVQDAQLPHPLAAPPEVIQNLSSGTDMTPYEIPVLAPSEVETIAGAGSPSRTVSRGATTTGESGTSSAGDPAMTGSGSSGGDVSMIPAIPQQPINAGSRTTPVNVNVRFP